MTEDETSSTGALVEAVARTASRPGNRLALIAVALAALIGLASAAMNWRVLDRLAETEKRERAVAAVVAAFAELATADTPAEQQAALDKIADAREDLPADSPVRRELESTTTTTSTPPASGAGVPSPSSTEMAAPPPPGTTSTSRASSTTTTTEPSLIDLPPIDVPPVDPPPIPCVPFVCRVF